MTQPYTVIGCAASAGGQRALSVVLAGLPADLPVPILIAQHLARDRETHTPDILARQTRLRVKGAEQGEAVTAGTVYIAIPDHHLLVQPDGTWPSPKPSACAIRAPPPTSSSGPSPKPTERAPCSTVSPPVYSY